MNSTFGQQLRACREEAKLTQKELGEKIHIDGSMISRLESGKAPPALSTLQALINALAIHDIPREKLDQLWVSAGWHPSQDFDTPVADPVVAFIQQEFEKLEPSERRLLSEDLRSVIEIDQAYFSARKTGRQRRWARAIEELLMLRGQMERRVQFWYLRIDEELGMCRYSNGHFISAIQDLGSALWSARQLDDLGRQAEVLLKLGDVHRRRGGDDWEIAYSRYEEAKNAFEALGDERGTANCIRKLAGVRLYQGRPHEAEALCNESLAKCSELSYEQGLYKGLQHKAWVCDLLGRWDEAAALGEEALDIVQNVTKDEVELVKALRYLGDAYRIQRRVGDAERAYTQALELLHGLESRGAGMKLLASKIKLRLGKVYRKQPGKEMEAKMCLNDGLESHRYLHEEFGIAEALIEQGELLLHWARFEDAEMRLRQAADILERLGNVFYYAMALSKLCELYFEKDEFQQVLQVAAMTRAIDNGLIDYHLARIELVVGKVYTWEDHLSDACNAIQAGSERALRFNTESYREFCGDLLAHVDQVAHQMAPGTALHICESFREFWQDREIKLKSQQVVQETLETIHRKEEQIKALAPM